jgi:IQ motif/SEC7 domain-containing protein
MAEPYELSQDLLDRQLEVLSSRYGGLGQATEAANTIQRAYRRYNMVKKFAAITSAVQRNAEQRLSRRLTAQLVGPGAGGVHRVRHVPGQGEDGWTHDTVTDSGPGGPQAGGFHHASCCVYQAGGKASYAGLARVAPVQSEVGESPALRPQPGHPAHHECHTPHCPAQGRGPSARPLLHTPHHHIGVRPGLQAEDDNHSDADIQSFPIDYLPDRSALACVNRLPGPGPSGGQRAIVSGRAHGPSHAHCANCGSGQALPTHHSHRGSGRQQPRSGTRAPDVPKRTVSRLTSLDVGESSELYPHKPAGEHRVTVSAPHSRTSSTHSSPRVPVALPAQQPKQQQAAAAKPRAQPGIPSRAKEVYHSNYAVNEVIRKRHYRTGLNIFNKKPERGIQYLIGEPAPRSPPGLTRSLPGKGFLDNSAQAVARFLITRKGLSKQMIGEYLGNISNPFNQAVTQCFANEMDLSGMQIDVALRKFQTYFR